MLNYAAKIRALMGKKPRTKAEMVKYLTEHFRYDTMNSWNVSRSYAQCVKVSRHPLFNGLTREQLNACYAMLEIDEAFHDVRSVLEEFAVLHAQEYQISFNGRSGGYLVLMQGGQRQTGHKSVCTTCGQRSFRRVIDLPVETPQQVVRRAIYCNNGVWTAETYGREPDIKALKLTDGVIACIHKEVIADIARNGEGSDDNTCGACHSKTRVNFKRPPVETYVMPGRGMDSRGEVEAMDIHQLRCRVDLVREFDLACYRAVVAFIEFSLSHRVVERRVPVTKKVMVAVPVESTDAEG